MKKHGNGSRRHGMAMIYIIVGMIAMFGFVSLAVDLGRVQTAKTELRRAVDATARAAVGNLSLNGGQSAANAANAAFAMAANNLVDGIPLVVNSGDIEFITWVGPNNYTVATSFATANAVQV